MNILAENGAQLTLEQLMPEIFQRQTVGVSAHHARISHFPENEKDLTETEVVSLEKFLESSTNSKKKINPNGLSMRMLKECLAATEDLIISQYSVSWIRGGYDTEWQVFNSKDYGVPQNRERVYTIGHFRKRGVRKIFPVAATNGENPIRIAQIGYDGSRERRNPDTFRVYDVGGGKPDTDNNGAGELRTAHSNYFRGAVIGIDKSNNGEMRTIANALTAKDYGVSKWQQSGTAIAYMWRKDE